MAKICGKWRIYLGIGLSVWETAKIFGKWRRSVGNVSNMWGNDIINWQTSCEKCEKWLRDLLNGKNLTNGLNMFEMTYIFGNWLKCLRNGQNIWEMT